MAKIVNEIRGLAIDGLRVESPEEKQWFLEQIAIRLGCEIRHLVYEPSKEPFPKPSAHPDEAFY